jgi:hypothetical protein
MRSDPAQWYPGNIYNMERAVSSVVHLPVPILVFVSGTQQLSVQYSLSTRKRFEIN